MFWTKLIPVSNLFDFDYKNHEKKSGYEILVHCFENDW